MVTWDVRASLALTLGLLFVSTALLALGHVQVRAQTDDIQDSVLVTGSLLNGVAPPEASRDTLTQLSNAELNVLLRGATIRRLGSAVPMILDCDGFYSVHWVTVYNPSADYFVPGFYSIRDDQL